MIQTLADLYRILTTIQRLLPVLIRLLRAVLDKADGQGNGAEAAGNPVSIPVLATAADYPSLSALLRDLPRSSSIDMVHLLELLYESPGLARLTSLAVQFALDEADPEDREDFDLPRRGDGQIDDEVIDHANDHVDANAQAAASQP